MGHDFVIVGSGPAGAALAYRLATAPSAPSVLLLEAGGVEDDPNTTTLGQRYTTFVTHPHLDWGYKTVPQKHLGNREIFYTRGKCLGGSSNINFCFYTRGAKDDFDEWARRVGDDFYNWENVERRYKKLEGFAPITVESHKKYAEWKQSDHGFDGPVKISDSEEWEGYQEPALLAGYENGWKKNMDVNSGDPIGMSVCATTGYRGLRTTAKTAYLDSPPPNLEIVTNATATKILFEGNRAVGITAGGKEYRAGKELILCAGALDTPKLLMLNGIGPKAELEKHGIAVRADLPVGRNLQDHLHFAMTVETKPGKNLRASYTSPEFMTEAIEKFRADGTGPLSVMYNSAAVGFAKSSDSVYESQAFKDLPADIQAYIMKPTVPTYEFAGLVPTAPIPGYDASKTYNTIMTFGMCPQSRGTVTLRSADFADAPVFDPNLFSHPFDRAVMFDAVRQTYKWLHDPQHSPDLIGPLAAPKSLDDKGIDDFIQQFGISTWHMSCTAPMGKPDDPEAVLTTDLKVKGFEALRVADLSVTPFLPNAHTVSIGYLIGEAAAERLIHEYRL